jgi:hypothetical protein
MSLKLNSSGGGSVTLQEPTTASNVTLNLPAADGTVVYENASGNVGIGTSSPNNSSGYKTLSINGTTGGQIAFQTNSSGLQFIYSTSTDLNFYNSAAGNLIFHTNNTERARIDSSGRLLVGTTSSFASTAFIQVNTYQNGAAAVGFATKPSTNANYDAADFYNSSGSLVGYISCTSSATTYATSSDYRLKHDIQPMTGALAKVAQLKPVTYKWNLDDSESQGFIAHELQEVVPDCVTGEKDAVDSEGKPKYQGIDTSFLVATLTAAIQEQQAMIEELKAKVAALEAQ